MEQLLRKIEANSLEASGQRFSIAAGLSIAAWNGEERLEELIQRANVALFRAKAKERNHVSLAA